MASSFGEGFNVRHRSQNWEGGKESSILYTGSDEGKSRKRKGSLVNPLIIPLLYPVCVFLVVYLIVLHFDTRLPQPITISNAVNKKGIPLFSAERAMGHLALLSGIGPRVTGSHENEVLAVEFLLREINWATASLAAREKDRVTISKQQAIGWYYLAFRPHGMMNTYEGIQNIAVKLASKRPSSISLLINCHFDSVPTSPGANDDGFHCAAMLELLRVLCEPNAPSLPHNVIFLFNGAEETPLQASHAFISQHEWAKEVRAVINLEAAGAGGREILFQAGPGNSWLIRAYAESVPFPYGNVIGEEVFQSGLVPSDTDFRVFRDYGNIPGLDFAHSRNGYVYHTKYDDISQTSLGAMQHTGDNLLALIQNLMSMQEFTLPSSQNTSKLSAESMKAKSVYFDVLGLYMVQYSVEVGYFLNILTVFLSLYVIFGKTFAGLSSRSENRWSTVVSGGIGFGGWIAGLLLVSCAATVLEYTGHSMSWFSCPVLIFPLFYCPAICGCLSLYAVAPSHLLETRSQKSKTEPWEKVYKESLGVQFIWTVILMATTAVGMRSSFIFMLIVLFPTLAHVLVALCYKLRFYPVKTWLITRHVFSLFPLFLVLYFGQMCFTLFVPIMGRIGGKLNPDLLIGILAVLFCILAFSHVVPLIHLVSSPRKIVSGLIAIHVLTFMAVAYTSIGFPFGTDPNAPTPQRAQVLHVQSREHSLGNSGTKFERSVFWMVDLDHNGVHFSLPRAVEHGCHTMPSKLCEEVLHCGMPVYSSRIVQLLPNTHVAPAPEPVIHEPADLKVISQKDLSTGVKRLTFSVTGPAHMSVILCPKSGASLKDWFFGEVPRATYFWQGRPTYHIHHTKGLISGQPWRFWVDIEVIDGLDTSWTVDVALVAHYTHGDPAIRASRAVNETLGPIAPWAHLVAWTATYDSGRF